MRIRNDKQLYVGVTEALAEKIRKAASDYHVSVSEIIRECIDKELPRLIDRENKRKTTWEKSDKHR